MIEVHWLDPYLSLGWSHEKCESLTRGYDTQHLTADFQAFLQIVEERIAGREVRFRTLRFELTHEFERDDLTLIAVARFSVKEAI